MEELRKREAAQESAVQDKEQLRPIIKQRLQWTVAGRVNLAGILAALGVTVSTSTKYLAPLCQC